MILPRTFAVAYALASLATAVSGKALNQFNPRAGAFEDYCAYVKTTIPYTVKKNSFVLSVDAGLCFQTVQSFIQTDALCQQALARGLDATDLLVFLSAAIEESKSYELCNFPKHAVEDPVKNFVCGFTCTDGFEVSPAVAPTTCKCPAGKTTCNGQCVWADPNTGGCPSAAPSKQKRQAKEWWVDDRCEVGQSVCGVVNGGPKAWECVDTSSDLWSCGGCAVEFVGSSASVGQDCSTIPNASSVACIHSECAVFECTKGHEPSHDGTSCVTENIQLDYLASQFGLEHKPFGA